MSPIALEKAIFPLDHHAEVLVVDEQHFDRQFLAERASELLDVHQEAPVAVDIDNELVRIGYLSAHRRR